MRSARGEPYGLVGSDCIENGTDCLGDNQDTDAYRFGVVGKLDSTQTVFMAGLDHPRPRNASNVSLAVYNMSDFTGVASLSQTNRRAVGFRSGALNGSAERMLKAIGKYRGASARLRAALPRLYVAAASRSCRSDFGDTCVHLSDTDTLPLSSLVALTQRAYVKPGKTTGADPDAMLTPVLVIRPRG